MNVHTLTSETSTAIYHEHITTANARSFVCVLLLLLLLLPHPSCDCCCLLLSPNPRFHTHRLVGESLTTDRTSLTPG